MPASESISPMKKGCFPRKPIAENRLGIAVLRRFRLREINVINREKMFLY
jgi:hypothetical protein